MAITIKETAPINASLNLNLATKHWPILGIYRDRPETHSYTLKTLTGVTLATGNKEDIEAHIADQGYMDVRR